MNHVPPLGWWLLLSALLVGACERKPANALDLEPRRVVATIYPLADIARCIGGKQVEVRWFIEDGQSLSDAPSGAIGPLQVADLVISRGVADSWATLQANDPASASIYLRVDLLDAAEGRAGYLWLDPRVARELADKIRHRLTEQRPEYADYFHDNEQALDSALDALVEQYKARIAAQPPERRRAMVSNSDFLPLADAIGMELIPVALESNEQQRAMEFDDIARRARAAGVTRIFIPVDRTPAYRRDLANRTGLEVRTLDPLGSSAPAVGRSTYLEIMRYNLEQLNK